MHLILWRNLNIFLTIFFLTGQVMGYSGRVELIRKKIKSGHESTHFCFGSKKSGSGQKILTRFSMSNQNQQI